MGGEHGKMKLCPVHTVKTCGKAYVQLLLFSDFALNRRQRSQMGKYASENRRIPNLLLYRQSNHDSWKFQPLTVKLVKFEAEGTTKKSNYPIIRIMKVMQ